MPEIAPSLTPGSPPARLFVEIGPVQAPSRQTLRSVTESAL